VTGHVLSSANTFALQGHSPRTFFALFKSLSAPRGADSFSFYAGYLRLQMKLPWRGDPVSFRPSTLPENAIWFKFMRRASVIGRNFQVDRF